MPLSFLQGLKPSLPRQRACRRRRVFLVLIRVTPTMAAMAAPHALSRQMSARFETSRTNTKSIKRNSMVVPVRAGESRIGKEPVTVPKGVTYTLKDNFLSVKVRQGVDIDKSSDTALSYSYCFCALVGAAFTGLTFFLKEPKTSSLGFGKR